MDNEFMRINVCALFETTYAPLANASDSLSVMGRTLPRATRQVATSIRMCPICSYCKPVLTGRIHSDGVGPNQICTLYGANPGQSDVSGHAYLEVGYQLNTHDIWRRNFLVLLGFFLLFQVTQVLLLEFYPVSTK